MKDPRKKGFEILSGTWACLVWDNPVAKAFTLGIAVLLFFASPYWAVARDKSANAAIARPTPFTAFCTWNGLRVMTALVQQYESGREARVVNFTPIVTEQVVGCLSRHQCDLGMTLDSRVPETSKREIGGYEQFMVGRFAVGVADNATNRIQAITLDDLQRVFTGQTASWKDVVGSSHVTQIEVCRPSATSTPGMVFRKTVLLRCAPRHTLSQPCANPQTEEKSDAEVVEAIIKRSNAIGFFLYRCGEQLDKRVRVLGVAKDGDSDAVVPSVSTIADGSYPLVDSLTLYLHPDAPASARDFCKFATGPEAAKIIKECGLWPEYELEKERGKQRVAEAKAGKGSEIVTCDLTGSGAVLKDLSFEFVKAKTAVQLKFQKAETRDEAVEKLNKGTIELLLADGPISESKDIKAVELGRMAVAVIVHSENTLESLPLDEVRGIFTGEIKKWPAVRGAAPAIKVFGLKQASSTALLLKEKLSQGGGKRVLKYTPLPDHEKVLLAVARDPAAIGFVDMSQLSPTEKSVRVVPVFDGTGPQPSPKRDGKGKDKSQGSNREISNHLEQTLTLYVSPNASQTAKDFAEFLTPEHCKETIAQYNLLPPRHTEDTKQLASRPKPAVLPKEKVTLTSADEPLPLLLDDPDAPQTQPRAKSKEPVAKPTSQAKPSEPTTLPVPATDEPKTSGLTDEQTHWLYGSIAAVLLSAVGIGWLSAPKRKKPRR